MSEAKTFDCWAIVEIMGHVTMAGRVTEQAIGGQSFIRIDVPEVGNQQAFTRFYGPGAIYGLPRQLPPAPRGFHDVEEFYPEDDDEDDLSPDEDDDDLRF
jgi:hypothetical protein